MRFKIPLPFDAKQLSEMFKDPNIDHVDVFDGKPEEIERRKKMVGKKYSLKPAYQKAPKIKSKK